MKGNTSNGGFFVFLNVLSLSWSPKRHVVLQFRWMSFLTVGNLVSTSSCLKLRLCLCMCECLTVFAPVFVPGPPSPPDSVTVEEVTDSTAQLAWSPGRDNGSPITSYLIQTRTPFTVGWQRVNTGSQHLQIKIFFLSQSRYNDIQIIQRSPQEPAGLPALIVAEQVNVRSAAAQEKP